MKACSNEYIQDLIKNRGVGNEKGIDLSKHRSPIEGPDGPVKSVFYNTERHVFPVGIITGLNVGLRHRPSIKNILELIDLDKNFKKRRPSPGDIGVKE
jgi:hypothetical protein